MAAERFAERVGRWQARYIGTVGHIALGLFTLLTPSTVGTTYSYVEVQHNIPAVVVGFGFIISGTVMGIARNKWIYWAAGVVPFAGFAIFSFGGALNHQVSFQAGIVYLMLAAYAFLVFPRGKETNGQ